MAILTWGVSFLRRLLDLHPVVNVLHIYLQNKNVYRNKKEMKRAEKRKKQRKETQAIKSLGGNPFSKSKQHCTFWYPKPKIAPFL
jgi:hypothetical protein